MNADHERALAERFHTRGMFYLRLSFPCLPSANGVIVEAILAHLRVHGRGFDESEAKALGELLQAPLAQGFHASPQTMLLVEIENDAKPPHKIRFNAIPQLSDAYTHWEEGRAFGDTADVKALALAVPGQRVLDVGAGTGRNTLALRAKGCTVDAIEREERFWSLLNAQGPAIHGDFFEHPLPTHAYDLVLLSEVVSSHVVTPLDLTRWLTRAREVLAPRGQLLASLFIADDGFALTEGVRELGAHVLTCVFTRGELDQALADAGLAMIACERVTDAERANESAWPFWLEAWATGRNLLDVTAPPLALHWVTARAANNA